MLQHTEPEREFVSVTTKICWNALSTPLASEPITVSADSRKTVDWLSFPKAEVLQDCEAASGIVLLYSHIHVQELILSDTSEHTRAAAAT